MCQEGTSTPRLLGSRIAAQGRPDYAMGWKRVDKLLEHCERNPGWKGKRRVKDLPDDLVSALKRFDGSEGFVGHEYLRLWGMSEIRAFNRLYRVRELLPGVVLLGSNGGGTAFGFAKTTGRYVSVP